MIYHQCAEHSVLTLKSFFYADDTKVYNGSLYLSLTPKFKT